MNYGYDVNVADVAVASGAMAGLGFTMIFMFLFFIFLLVCMYKVYKKAGRKGWEALVPIYNIVVLMQIAGLPSWYIVLYFVPIANIYVMFKTYIELAHKFGKSTGFGILLIFFSFVFLPILAFGDATYNGGDNNVQTMTSNEVPVAPVAPVMDTQPIMNPTPINEGVNMMNNQNMNTFNVEPNNFMGNINGLDQTVNPIINEIPVVSATPVAPVNEVQTAPQILGTVAEPTPIVNEVSVTPIEPTIINEQVSAPIVEETQPAINVTPIESVPTVNPVVEPVAQPTEVKPMPVQPETPKKFCPNCGNQVDQNDAMCFMCGNKF